METPSASKIADLSRSASGIDGFSRPHAPIRADELTQRVTEVNKPPRNLRAGDMCTRVSETQLIAQPRAFKRAFPDADPLVGQIPTGRGRVAT
jgi:hypothetical protein